MNRKVVSCAGAVAVFIMSFCVHYMLFAAQIDEEKMQLKRKERPITSSRHRKGKAPKVEDVMPEQPIENMQQFITTFDHVAKAEKVNELLQKAVAFCNNKKIDEVCHAFTHTGEFKHGALYIFLLDMKGTIYAHGEQETLLWKNLWNKRDMFGALVIQEMIKLAQKGGGSLTYEWDGAVKVSRIAKVTINGKDFVIGCGYYPHSKEYEVVGLVKGAVALFDKYKGQNDSVSGAFSDMTYPLSQQFIFGDLYLYALDFQGKIFAQGDRPGLVGSSSLEYTDSQGKAYNKEIIEKLKTVKKGEGIWIEYISKNAKKRTYAEKVTDEKGNNYFIACGYYPEITHETAVDLVRKGYQLLKSSGLSIAVKEFNDREEEHYRYGDLFLFLYDEKGTALAYGKNPDVVDQNQWNNKDEDGRYYVQEIIQLANRGGGWITYKTNHSFQSTYVEKVDIGIGSYIIGAGIFPISKPDTMELLVKSALDYLQNHSMDQFLGRLVDRNDEFLRGDLYMYVFDFDGFCYGWADDNNLIWRHLIDWKDETGKLFVRSMIESASQGPDHQVITLNNSQRVTYFHALEKEGKKYVLGSGFYK